MPERFYLDYNASAPLRVAARDAVLQTMAETGNASSLHSFGRAARATVEKARGQVAGLCGTVPAQVFFTSGATESNNAVLKSFKDQRVLVSAIEHPSVLEAAPEAERIPVTANGDVDRAAFEKMLRQGQAPSLISIMLANNETGVIQKLGELARMALAIHPDVRIHTDATQGLGRIPVDFGDFRADYMSLSAHKIGGPQGVGALITAPGAIFSPLLQGGGQERRIRAGTENVAGIAGFGAACEESLAQMGDQARLAEWRDRMEDAILTIEPRACVVGRGVPRLGNTSMIALPGIPAETQLIALDLAGMAVSSGSACSSGTVKASHVLEAMGLPASVTGSALRISMGWDSRESDVDAFVKAWQAMCERVRDRIAGPVAGAGIETGQVA